MRINTRELPTKADDRQFIIRLVHLNSKLKNQDM